LLISGGAFGLEGSLILTAAEPTMLLVLVIAHRTTRE
jgi:hypothetical protein